MNDIFISTLTDRLPNWSEAFPASQCVRSIDAVMLDKNAEAVFWLHKNQSGQNLPDDKIEQLSHNIRTILADYPAAKVVVLANNPQQAESIQTLRLGVMGYCHAYTDAAVLKKIREVISRGGLWIGQDFLQRLIESSTKLLGSQQHYIDELLAKLTAREQEVALEVAKGLSNKEIARVLTITERTVKAHLAHIFERLGAKDRLQLALMFNKNI